jgi:hypothetical protein
MAFTTTLQTFCNELRGTFPELSSYTDRALTTTPAQFWKSWSANLEILVERDDAALHTQRRGFLVGAVRITESLWKDVSETTQKAIWKYLRTLLLEASMELPQGVGEGTMTSEQAQAVLDILTQERLESGDHEAAREIVEDSLKHMNPLLERLRGMLGGAIDLSGGFTMPEIPEHLRNGKIARLAEELSKQFNPADFGIDPALLEGENVEDILQRLMNLYKSNPELLMSGAKRVADRIKKQILSGTIKQEDLIAEAKDYVKLFKDHPQFKEAFEKFESIFGEEGVANMFQQNPGAPSERLRAAQERLRRKRDARLPTKNP